MPRLRTPLGVAIALALAIIIVLLAAASVDAQVVRGEVTVSTDDRPVVGALIRLISADSQQVAMLLTDRAGRFVVVAPRQGRYVLQAEHIHYTTTRTTAFTVPATGAITVNIAIPVRDDTDTPDASASRAATSTTGPATKPAAGPPPRE